MGAGAGAGQIAENALRSCPCRIESATCRQRCACSPSLLCPKQVGRDGLVLKSAWTCECFSALSVGQGLRACLHALFCMGSLIRADCLLPPTQLEGTSGRGTRGAVGCLGFCGSCLASPVAWAGKISSALLFLNCPLCSGGGCLYLMLNHDPAC